MPFEPWKEETPDAVQEQEAPPEPVAEAAPPPEVQAEPAPAPEARAPEPAPEKRTDDSVPLAKALEWRNQWRQSEAKLQEVLKRLEDLERPKEQVQIPRYEDDPVEHLRVKTELSERALAEIREREAQQAQEAQRMAARQQFVGWYQQEAAKFSAQQQDFGDAYKHAISHMTEVLQQASDNPREVMQALEAWESGIVRRAAEAGKNPAAALYEVAQRMGYAKPAPPAPSQPSEVDKVTSIAEAKERSKSLGPSRAAEPAEEEDDDMGGLKTLFEAQSEMGLRRRK